MRFNLNFPPIIPSAKTAGDRRAAGGFLEIIKGTGFLKGNLQDCFKNNLSKGTDRPFCLVIVFAFSSYPSAGHETLPQPSMSQTFCSTEAFLLFMAVFSRTLRVMICTGNSDVCVKDVPGQSPTAPGPAAQPQASGDQLSPASCNLVGGFAVEVFNLPLNHLGALRLQMPGLWTSCSDLVIYGWGLDIGIFQNPAGDSDVPWAENLLFSSPAT